MAPFASLAHLLRSLCFAVLLITATTLLVPALESVAVQAGGHDSVNAEWANHGGGILNHRSAAVGPGRSRITAGNVRQLALRWRFATGFDVTATPAVADGAVYFPGWNGMLYALDETTGTVRWAANLSRMIVGSSVAAGASPEAGASNFFSRATPVVAEGGLLLVGMYGPAVVLAIRRRNGRLVWMSAPLDVAAHSVITMSGTAYQGHYYVGVSSLQEGFDSGCCTFRGSFQKLALRDGSVVWKTPMLPPASAYYGAAVWGSSPSIDADRRLVFIATGNNYEVPQSVKDCESKRSNRSGILQTEPDPCVDRSVDRHDSIVAMRIDDGSIAWSSNFQAYDVWTIACQYGAASPNCPAVLGPDYDFGEAPMLLHLDDQHSDEEEEEEEEEEEDDDDDDDDDDEDGDDRDRDHRHRHHHHHHRHRRHRRRDPQHKIDTSGSRRKQKCLVVAGQKSGVVWALDCDTGAVVWSTAAGPGGQLGGAMWGSSFDGERVYTNIANFGRARFTLAPGRNVTRGGGWVAMDARTGRVLWSTAAPPEGTLAFGPVSSAQGVVFTTAFSASGGVFALDALDGSVLWSASTGAVVYGGVSVARSCIFVGNGYSYFSAFAPGSPNGTHVSAFCLP